MKRRLSVSPATIIATAALFFALGGSAFGLVDAVRPQPRCAPGAVRGVAAVTGEPGKGIANIGGDFSDRKTIFSEAFNCTGGRPQARRVSTGVYEVRFPGNGARAAVVSGEAEMTVKDLGGGAFRVTLWVPGRQDATDAPFTLILG
jgi:hypothetical protein